MFLAIRELKHAKFRYLLIGCIMLLVAWLTFIVSGLANGLALDNASAMKNMNGDYFVLQKSAEQKLARSSIQTNTLDEIRKEDGVEEAVPLSVATMSFVPNGEEKKVDVTVFGVERTSMIMPDDVEGSSIQNVGEHEAVVDASLKRQGIELGDTLINEDFGITFTVVGFAEGQMFSHMPVLYTDTESFQTMMKETGRQKEPAYNAVVVKGETSISESNTHVEVLTKDGAMQGIPGYKEEQGSLTMMIAFLLIIAAFIQAVFFYVITLQKTNQFGVLKAIGAKTSYLAKNLIGQVLLLATVAIGISITLTFGISALFPESMPFELGIDVIIKYALLLIGVAVLGALLSLRRIAKIDAIEAIGRVE
ncbi:ABC transporter permease [Priestia taiwanensis]|uniref:Putative hemin transport system permease protein HrtB n=1 Tax=Priestia taiwanensis TaxID=1347902 RepID=A0A917AWJ5_9BACI|nr:ABC transporter permease [Priestia taiwanensis]MBM7364486.1 putative ABC transport system permease protein [Priestia taiwanensis]GGE81094.1 ABC transporter permease [Priestia taiwanensis]